MTSEDDRQRCQRNCYLDGHMKSCPNYAFGAPEDWPVGEALFYIWDTRQRESAVFWRTAGAGYTTNLDDAGRFTADEIKKRGLEWHQVAVPCATVDAVAHRAVSLRMMPEPPSPPKWFLDAMVKATAGLPD